MKIWLDDVRLPPDDSWTWAQTSREAITYLSFADHVDEVSLDFDLGLYDTGEAVAQYIAQMNNPPSVVRIHSMNPAGRDVMRAILLDRAGLTVIG